MIRAKGRVAVRLEFRLPVATRVFLIVRGPAPSCRVVGVIPFKGRKGWNAARFAGRVQGRVLEPGVYLITVSPLRRFAAGAPTEYVRVVSPRRSVPLREGARRPSCSEKQAFAADPTARLLRFEGRQAAILPAPRPARPAALFRPPLQEDALPRDRDEKSGGLSRLLPSPGSLTPGAGSEGLEAVVTVAILVLVGALLIAMLALVTRFLRGSWNP